MYLSGELGEAPDGGHLLRAAGQEGVPGGEPGRESSTSRQHVGKSRVGDDRDGGTRVKVHSSSLALFPQTFRLQKRRGLFFLVLLPNHNFRTL